MRPKSGKDSTRKRIGFEIHISIALDESLQIFALHARPSSRTIVRIYRF
jgi:hypothetical protein